MDNLTDQIKVDSTNEVSISEETENSDSGAVGSNEEEYTVVDIADDSNCSIANLEPENNSITVINIANDSISSCVNGEAKESEHAIVNLTEECVWNIDDAEEEEEGTDVAEKKLRKSSVDFSVPCYGTHFTGYLTEKEYSIDTGKHVKNDCTPKRTCFNCLGDHNINECKEKKDFQAIARNKKNILGKRPSSTRYHEVGENLYSSYKPGEISENLRSALRLRPFQAPEFVYRMRVLGYPPGWLKEAEVKRSEVSLFDGTGKPLCHPEEEEGEMDVSRVKYKPEKLLAFPGFNTDFPTNIEDQCRQLNYPTMQPHHKMDSFLSFMTRNRAIKYKRKKLKASATPQSSEDQKISLGEMEVDESHSGVDTILEFNPPLPKEVNDAKPPEPHPEPQAPEEKREEGELSEDSNDAVKASTTLNSSTTVVEDTPSLSVKLNSSTTVVEDTPSPSVKRKPTTDSESSCDSPLPTRKRLHNSSSKGFSLGVSIPDSITPFDKLPNPDQWSVNVSDHLLFINLPDALGTWKKMKGIVKNVQGVMKDLHVEDDDD